MCPISRELGVVIGMDCDECAFVLQRLRFGETCELEPPIVDPFELPLRIARPDDLWQRVGQHSLEIHEFWVSRRTTAFESCVDAERVCGHSSQLAVKCGKTLFGTRHRVNK